MKILCDSFVKLYNVSCVQGKELNSRFQLVIHTSRTEFNLNASKTCCAIFARVDTLTPPGTWLNNIYSDPEEWYESIMRWLNKRLQPTDVISSVTLTGFVDIKHSELISDMSIIHEDLIENHICDLFIVPRVLCFRHPKTVWGNKGNPNKCTIADRRSIWNMGVWTAGSGAFKIDLSSFGGLVNVHPWRRDRYAYWNDGPFRVRMDCRHRVRMDCRHKPVVGYADEEKLALRRSKRLLEQ